MRKVLMCAWKANSKLTKVLWTTSLKPSFFVKGKLFLKNVYCNEIFVTLPRVLKNLICLLE